MSWKIHSLLGESDWYWRLHTPGNHRTAYVIGLYGSGRDYIGGLIKQHIGERAKYFSSVGGSIRLRRVQTSMIYSGHATLKYPSIGQAAPAVGRRLVEAARSGLVDLIFICRNPLDSLLSNWIWGRQINRGCKLPGYVSEIYKNADHLCEELEQNFSDFEAFSQGDPYWFMGGRRPRFLSFVEFVEETYLFLQSAPLTLRLEDFMIDPLTQFSKIVEAMRVDIDLSGLAVAAPKTRCYRYLDLRQRVSRFRDFVDGLDPYTKSRLNKLGYGLSNARAASAENGSAESLALGLRGSSV